MSCLLLYFSSLYTCIYTCSLFLAVVCMLNSPSTSTVQGERKQIILGGQKKVRSEISFFRLDSYCQSTSHLMSLVQRLLPGLSTSLSSILRLSRMAAPPRSPSPLSETLDGRPTKRAKMSDDPSCTTSAAVDMSPTDEAALVETIMADPLEYPKAAYYHDLDYRDKLVLAPMVRSGTCESLFHLLCSNDGS